MELIDSILNKNIKIIDLPPEQISSLEVFTSLFNELTKYNYNSLHTYTELPFDRDAIIYLIKHSPEDEKAHVIIQNLMVKINMTYNELPIRFINDLNLVALCGYFDMDQILHRKDLLSNKFWMETYVKDNPKMILSLPKKIKNNYDFIIECLSKSPDLFPYLTYSIHKNELPLNENINVIKLALRTSHFTQHPSNWQFVGESLKNNKDFILSIIESCPKLFKFLDPIFRNDVDIVSLVVSQYGSLLEYASDSMKNNRYIASLACTLDSEGFKFISKELRNNPDFLFNILSKFPTCIFDCGESIKKNNKIARLVCSQAFNELSFFSFFDESIRSNKDIIFIELKNNFESFLCLDIDLLNNKDFILSVIQKFTFPLKFIHKISDDMKKDEDIMFPLFRQNNDFLYHFDKELLQSYSKMLSLLETVKNFESSLKIVVAIPFERGDEIILRTFMNTPSFHNYYSNYGDVQFNQKLASINYIKSPYLQQLINENPNINEYLEFYFNSFTLSQQLENDLNVKNKIKKIKL